MTVACGLISLWAEEMLGGAPYRAISALGSALCMVAMMLLDVVSPLGLWIGTGLPLLMTALAALNMVVSLWELY